MSKRAWPSERIALLRDEYSTTTDMRAFMARLNEIPAAEQIGSIRAVQEAARTRGLKKTPATRTAIGQNSAALRDYGAPPAAPGSPRSPPPTLDDMTPEQQAEAADRDVLRKQSLARAMLARRVTPQKISEHTRLPLREVLRLAGEARMEGV